MKGAARQRGPFQRHRRAVFFLHGQTGIYPVNAKIIGRFGGADVFLDCFNV